MINEKALKERMDKVWKEGRANYLERKSKEGSIREIYVCNINDLGDESKYIKVDIDTDENGEWKKLDNSNVEDIKSKV